MNDTINSFRKHCGRGNGCEDMSISPQFFDRSGRSVDLIDMS